MKLLQRQELGQKSRKSIWDRTLKLGHKDYVCIHPCACMCVSGLALCVCVSLTQAECHFANCFYLSVFLTMFCCVSCIPRAFLVSPKRPPVVVCMSGVPSCMSCVVCIQ